MAKITPPADFPDDSHSVADPLPALKEVGATRAPVYNLDVSEIVVLPDFNPRITGTPEYEAHIANLVASINENGFMQNKPLLVRAVEDEDAKDEAGNPITVFYLIAGHSRFEAIQRHNAKAIEVERITTVPVVTTDQSMAELTLQTVHDNNVTKPLSPVELGIVVRRLLGYGLDKPTIAKRMNISARYVDDLLVLDAAPVKVKDAVRTGKMSATLAVETIRKQGAEAPKAVEKAIKDAEAIGKTKVTPKQMAAQAKPSKEVGKAKIEKAKKTAKPAKKPDPIKGAVHESIADVASAITEAAPGLPATDTDFLRGAIDYALSLPKKGGAGLDWLAKMVAEDAATIGELESWLGQPKGAFFDASLRVPVDKESL